MGKEYELQVLEVDLTKMRKKLKDLGGKKIHHNIKLERSVYHRCNTDIKGFVRVRNDGKNTSMTVKVYNNNKFPDEYEVTIKEDFIWGAKPPRKNLWGGAPQVAGALGGRAPQRVVWGAIIKMRNRVNIVENHSINCEIYGWADFAISR